MKCFYPRSSALFWIAMPRFAAMRTPWSVDATTSRGGPFDCLPPARICAKPPISVCAAAGHVVSGGAVKMAMRGDEQLCY